MKISKPVKILIGMLTAFAVLAPLLTPGFIMANMISSGFPFYPFTGTSTSANPNELFRTMAPMMLVVYPLMMCYSVVDLGLKVFYIIHQVKNKTLTDTYRILFIIGTFILPWVAMPLYFIIYLLKDEPQEIQTAPA